MKHVDVLVRGAGIVGQSLALSLARLGLQVGLCAAPPRSDATPDVRAYALNAASVALLRSLKVWDSLPAQAATPVYDMHVQGDAEGAAIDFSAWEQKVGELAWIVDAPVLERALGAAVRFSPHIHALTPAAADRVQADLTALCEGKESASRARLGVDFERHDYGHSAIAARLLAARPHGGTARQWFRSPDVLALLPFDSPQPSCSYALVWSMPRERAHELMALDDSAFAAALMEASRGEAGELTLASPRAEWPLAIAEASAWSGPGWVLLGDAAHEQARDALATVRRHHDEVGLPGLRLLQDLVRRADADAARHLAIARHQINAFVDHVDQPVVFERSVSRLQNGQ